MTEHRCSPYDIEYGDTVVRCTTCGRTWMRGPFRYQLINPGASDDVARRAERRRAATTE